MEVLIRSHADINVANEVSEYVAIAVYLNSKLFMYAYVHNYTIAILTISTWLYTIYICNHWHSQI